MRQINQETVNVEVFYVPTEESSSLRCGSYKTSVNLACTNEQIAAYFMQSERKIVITAGGVEYGAQVTHLKIDRASLKGLSYKLINLGS